MAAIDLTPIYNWPGYRIPDTGTPPVTADYRVDFTPLVAGVGEGAMWIPAGGEILIVEPKTVNTTTISILGVATSALNRIDDLDIVWTTGDSSHIVIGPIPSDGFKQVDGFIYVEVDEICDVAVFRR